MRLSALVAIVIVAGALGWFVLSGGPGPGAHRRSATAVADGHCRRPGPTRLPLAGIPVGRWTAIGVAPSSRGEVSAARIGGAAYVVGGFDAAGHTTGQVQRLDLRSGQWRGLAPLPQPLNHMSAVSYAGRLYVVGGYSQPGDTSAGAVRGFWRYDPRSRRWRAMPDAPVARAAAGAAVLGHRLYVIGGRNDAVSALSSTAIFDFDTGRWTRGPSLAHPREHLAAVAAGGAVWALGGRALGLGSFTYVERYRPGAGGWQPMTSMPAARSGFQAVPAAGSIVVVGGEDGPSTVAEVDRLDPVTGRWTRLPDLPLARHGLGVVADGPLVFAIDGGPQPGLTTSRVVDRLRVR